MLYFIDQQGSILVYYEYTLMADMRVYKCSNVRLYHLSYHLVLDESLSFYSGGWGGTEQQWSFSQLPPWHPCPLTPPISCLSEVLGAKSWHWTASEVHNPSQLFQHYHSLPHLGGVVKLCFILEMFYIIF